MTTQPEALRIAEVFETYAVDHKPDGWPAIRQETLNSAAAELRRLHAENEALRVALEQPGVEPVAYLYHDARTPKDAHPWLHSTMLVLAADRRPGLRGETPLYTAPQAQQPDARATAIKACIDRLVFGGQPAAAQILRHHFAKDLGEE